MLGMQNGLRKRKEGERNTFRLWLSNTVIEVMIRKEKRNLKNKTKIMIFVGDNVKEGKSGDGAGAI